MEHNLHCATRIFKDIHKGSSLALFLTGSSTYCCAMKCTFQEGTQAITARNGAQFTACMLDIKNVPTTAIEAVDPTTHLLLNRCKFSGFDKAHQAVDQELVAVPVLIQNSAFAVLTKVTISEGSDWGVHACEKAHVKMRDCRVHGSNDVAVRCYNGTDLLLEGCVFSDIEEHGVVLDAGSCKVEI